MGERVILVTGASSGLGAAAARRLAREPGARVVLVARRAERLEALAAALPAPATWVAADLTAADAPERVRAHVEEHHGALHVLVNNAGRGARGRFGDSGYANVRAAMELNFDAQLRLTEALLPLLRARRRARSSTWPAARPASRARARRRTRPRRPRWPAGATASPPRRRATASTSAPCSPASSRPRASRSASWSSAAARAGCSARPSRPPRRSPTSRSGGRAERYVPRFYGALVALRTVAPPLVRRVLAGGGADRLATTTRE